ncbi:DUF3772 domain-containing protein [Alloyangia pacifica]|uniref:Small-conductance mechanosensitive channel n=1 Tax=Alloyangia pacifica TaxID=311180 RepID=A0A1I6PMJ5_9RHOB|nr:DUF3772 domain-containing protein [Alloyangia pacifica]SDG31526.1 Small-conductance mechanosensitive channel [Alloyangia pacifica]SFS41406.1 Small-conductance mechanosensitive channel [Alloyangia pacifica]
MIALIRRLLAACAVTILCATLAVAQAQDIDYETWGTLAKQADGLLDGEDVTVKQYEDLRSDIAGWRDSFLRAESTNASRIETLQQQLDTLGPAPAEGESEAEDIAQRRADLTEQLSNAQAPVRRAQEAFTQANGLIGEIDTKIREMQTSRLLTLGPSPLNWQLWGPAANDVAAAGESLVQEVRDNVASENQRAAARENLPIIILLVGLSALLVIRGPSWVRRIEEWLRRRTRRGTGVWRFLASLGSIVVPLGGLILLVVAATISGLPGTNLTVVMYSVPIWGLVLLYIRWLAGESFNSDDDIATMPLPNWQRTEAWLYSSVLALLFVLRGMGQTLSQIFEFSDETNAVLDFPLIVLSALMLFRLGYILSGLSHEEPEEGEGTLLEGSTFRMQLARMIGRLAMLLALFGPIMAAVGYHRVGQGMVFPAVQSLSLLALVLVLQRFIKDLYALITRKDPDDSLITVLAGVVLILLALPMLALIWGARVADLTELWARFQEGFLLGDARISPTSFLTMLVVFAVGYGVTRLLQSGLRSSILPKTKLDIGGQNAVISGLGYAGVMLAAVMAITAAGINLTALGYVISALSVGIGFGLQNIVQNFVSGIILLIERPISQGDWIEVGPNMGIVKDISVRATRIETFDRTDVIVPNSDFISGTVTNFTRGNVIGRVFTTVGVAYGSDTRKVEEILLRIVREHDMVLLNPEPSVVFARFGADSLEFEIRAIVRDVNQKVKILSDFNHEINARFVAEGIEVPFAQRDIWLRNPESLYPPQQKRQDSDAERGSDQEFKASGAQNKTTDGGGEAFPTVGPEDE